MTGKIDNLFRKFLHLFGSWGNKIFVNDLQMLIVIFFQSFRRGSFSLIYFFPEIEAQLHFDLVHNDYVLMVPSQYFLWISLF